MTEILTKVGVRWLWGLRDHDEAYALELLNASTVTPERWKCALPSMMLIGPRLRISQDDLKILKRKGFRNLEPK